MTATLDEAISAWPDRLLTLADWEALGEDATHRLECSEGVLAVTPRPLPAHQRAARRLANQLETALPGDRWAVETECELLLAEAPLTVRVPDVLVVSAAAFAANPPRFTPDQIALAVEVLSPGSRRTDRVLKLAEYAEAGIPQYWFVELGLDGETAVERTPVVTAHAAMTAEAGRHSNGYQQLGTYSSTSTVRVAGHPVTINPTGLTGQ